VPGDGQDSPDSHERKRRVAQNLWREGFLAQLSLTGIVTDAANKAGVARSTVLKARADDPEFAAAMIDAREQAIDHLEREARKRAFAGYDEPVFQGGELVGHRQRYSDDLAKFLLSVQRYREHGTESGLLRDTAATDAQAFAKQVAQELDAMDASVPLPSAPTVPPS